MNIIIGGDMVPRENNISLFEEGNIEKIMGKELKDIWNSSDYKVFNLEAPITNCSQKIKKCGPNLKIAPKSIKGIKLMDPTVVFLSNNHIMDYGKNGLEDTINILEENNIDYVGIGRNIKDIKKNYIIENEGLKIAIYNCCETEFSVATNNYPGANPCDVLKIWEDIKNSKEKNNYVIIIYHGGKEHYRYPSPYLQKLCRKMTECGADLVVCQHSHCIGCYEVYKGRTIVYGQGNFIFDGQDNEYWNTSLLIEIDLDNEFEIKYIPICKTEEGTRLANEKERKKILDLFEKRSEYLKDNNFITQNYREFSRKYVDNYLQSCHGDNLLYKILNKICFHKLTKKMYSEESLLRILNIVECEAHRELFIEGLKDRIN